MCEISIFVNHASFIDIPSINYVDNPLTFEGVIILLTEPTTPLVEVSQCRTYIEEILGRHTDAS